MCGKRLAVGTCAVCSRLVCDECSIQYNPVVRICVECRSRGGKPPRKPPSSLVRLTEKWLAELIREAQRS
ncbi:hypothetical protein [Pyrolobus fumarii]|uniref:hypothetical protein n=1 Tax=Pyrolobus fumarii TaxID=54252 RepID=UPI001432EEBA|nr:hypothetical protein [Pyrolobus fumarii]